MSNTTTPEQQILERYDEFWYRPAKKIHLYDDCRYITEKHRQLTSEQIPDEHREVCAVCENRVEDEYKNVEYTDADLLEWIDSFVEAFGIVPTETDFRGEVGPYPQAFRRHFGSWPAAIEKAGYEPRDD
jgi:hypothetical protein